MWQMPLQEKGLGVVGPGRAGEMRAPAPEMLTNAFPASGKKLMCNQACARIQGNKVSLF